RIAVWDTGTARRDAATRIGVAPADAEAMIRYKQDVATRLVRRYGQHAGPVAPPGSTALIGAGQVSIGDQLGAAGVTVATVVALDGYPELDTEASACPTGTCDDSSPPVAYESCSLR